MLFNILLYSQINISLWTNFIFTDHLSIWLANYRSFYSRLSNLQGAAILQLLAHINLSSPQYAGLPDDWRGTFQSISLFEYWIMGILFYLQSTAKSMQIKM